MASTSIVGGTLETSAHITTAEGKDINLGVLDKKVGIKIDFFGKKLSLQLPWTPRLWYYKHVTYHIRQFKLSKKEG